MDAAVPDFVAAEVNAVVTDGGTVTVDGVYEGGTFECVLEGEPARFLRGSATTASGRIDVPPSEN
ncbi:hypothetical protein FJ656_15790 [Schumannella luteola]|nr:hypothetical protein FJ656_15790 [Schumannella luteola]